MMRLRQLRNQKNLTQKDIADFLGCGRTTYVKYETGVNEPNLDTLKQLAGFYNVSLDYLTGNSDSSDVEGVGIRIPVLGRVQAGIPFEAVEEILDWEEISPEMAATGDYFALRIRGQSMEPRMCDGDVIIIRKQSDVDNGDIAVVLVNGFEATVKKIKKTESGVTLIPSNPAFDPIFYANDEIKELPVQVIGKVVELRAKY